MDKIKAAKLDELTYGEVEVFEEIVGSLPTTEAEMEKMPKAKMMTALGFIAASRVEPEMTLADFRKLPVGTVVFEESDPN